MCTARSFQVIGLLAALFLSAACADEGPTGPDVDEVRTLTVDASADWAYIALGETAEPVAVPDPGQSDAWDLAFYATSVMLNGGDAGPGVVVGHCLCRNADASDEAVQSMTPETELEDFLEVGLADVPAGDDAWTSDALAPAITGWYAYDPATHQVSAAPEKVWKIRTAEGDAYAKFHVTGLEGGTQQSAGRVTIEFAVQAEAGAVMGEVRTVEIDVSAGPVYFDLVAGAESDAVDWDLLFEGWTIRVNGGVSGEGSAGAVAVEEDFAAIQDASDLSAGHYKGDAYGGVFDEHRWYRYNLAGGHQIWPTYDVYLVRVGQEVYKLQLIGYYGDTGDSRQITFRYARIEE